MVFFDILLLCNYFLTQEAEKPSVKLVSSTCAFLSAVVAELSSQTIGCAVSCTLYFNLFCLPGVCVVSTSYDESMNACETLPNTSDCRKAS